MFPEKGNVFTNIAGVFHKKPEPSKQRVIWKHPFDGLSLCSVICKVNARSTPTLQRNWSGIGRRASGKRRGRLTSRSETLAGVLLRRASNTACDRSDVRYKQPALLGAASPAGSSCFRAACREEKQAQKQVREAAKRGDVASARLLAKELVRTRKATTQLYTNKAHMIAMGTQLQEQLAMVKVRGCVLGCYNIGLGWGQS